MNSWSRLQLRWLDDLIHDLRFGVRLWWKKPGSFVSATAALTLGIGLVTFSLSAIQCIFFGKLPFPDSDRVVYTTIPARAFREFNEQQTTFEGLSAFGTASVNFKAVDAPSRRRACLIDANFLDLIRAQPLIGRGFLPGEDKPGAERVALIGYDLWQQEYHGDPAWLTVVGCVPDLKYEPLTENPRPIYFVPVTQRSVGSMVIMLRGSGRAADWAKTLRTEVSRLQPDLAIHRVATMRTLIDHQTFGYYLASLLLGICGGGSLFLANLGIFGLISLSVNQRTRENGVRLALGAKRARIVMTLLKRAAWQIIAGVAVGVLMALALNQLLTHAIAGYPAVDHPALVLLATVTFLGTISMIAVLIPAMRGARVDPTEALRCE